MYLKPHRNFSQLPMSRRTALTTLSAIGLASCGGAGDSSETSIVSNAANSSSSSSSSNGSCTLSAPSCVVAPTETYGPYPAFTNGVVTLASLWRTDMTTDPSGTYSQRQGVPLEMLIKLVNVNDNCAPLVGYDVYVWHCDADGYYSYYSGQPGYLGTKSYPNGYFLRAVQTTDACGEVTFTTIFPGWYPSRYTHVHIAVSISAIAEAVTQMTWPASVITDVYTNATTYGTYTEHGAADTTFSGDNVFQGNTGQIASTTGSIDEGFQSQWVLGITV